MAAGLGQHARVRGVREPEAAELLGNDQAEQAEFAQRLDELVGLVRVAVPFREVRLLALEEAVDRLDDHAQHFAVALADGGVGEEVFLEDVAQQQLLGDALVAQQAVGGGAREASVRSRSSWLPGLVAVGARVSSARRRTELGLTLHRF